jgi:hypothetical protein
MRAALVAGSNKEREGAEGLQVSCAPSNPNQNPDPAVWDPWAMYAAAIGRYIHAVLRCMPHIRSVGLFFTQNLQRCNLIAQKAPF